MFAPKYNTTIITIIATTKFKKKLLKALPVSGTHKKHCQSVRNSSEIIIFIQFTTVNTGYYMSVCFT